MPTISELRTLYKKRAGSRNMTPLLETTGWWVWVGERKGWSSVRDFGFYRGRKHWNRRDNSDLDRVLRCVPEDNDRLFGYLIIRGYRGIYPPVLRLLLLIISQATFCSLSNTISNMNRLGV